MQGRDGCERMVLQMREAPTHAVSYRINCRIAIPEAPHAHTADKFRPSFLWTPRLLPCVTRFLRLPVYRQKIVHTAASRWQLCVLRIGLCVSFSGRRVHVEAGGDQDLEYLVLHFIHTVTDFGDADERGSDCNDPRAGFWTSPHGRRCPESRQALIRVQCNPQNPAAKCGPM